MKTLLSFVFSILFSFLSFAQVQLPDSIFLVDGRSANCLVTKIDDAKVYFRYSQNQKESIIVKALNRVYIEKFGNIYSLSTGYTVNPDEVNDFLESRIEKIRKEAEIKAELNRVDLVKKSENKNIINQSVIAEETELFTIDLVDNGYSENKWSFGVLYVPYYSGRTYEMYQNINYPYQFDLYAFAVNSTNLEAQIAYSVLPFLKLTFDAGYSAAIVEENYEYHSRYNDSNYSSFFDSGYESTNKMKKLDLNIGAKYYFNNIISEKVSIYALIGIGKQFAFYTEDYKQLFSTPTPGVIDENNRDEFESDINSPFHFNIGFGAEYFFNKSLSLNTNIRVLYNSASGTYESRHIDLYNSITSKEEMSISDFTTKIGLGLNFYF